MFKIFGKKKAPTIEINVIESGVRIKVFETPIKEEAIAFLERNMHADTEIGVIENGLRTLGRVIVTILMTGKLIEVKINK